jgi:hypothetical protein
MLGIHISVAAAWQRDTEGDWTTYCADVSRRKPSSNRTNPMTSARPTTRSW